MHNLVRNKCVSVWNQLDGWLTNDRQFAEKYDLFELIIFAICCFNAYLPKFNRVNGF